MEKLNLTERLQTTDGTPCRLICSDFIRTLDGVKFNLVVAVTNEFGEENLCLCTENGETRNGLFNVLNVNESGAAPLIDWNDFE